MVITKPKYDEQNCPHSFVFCLSWIFLACKKTSPNPDGTSPFEYWKLHGETIGRPGAGFSWRLSTPGQTDSRDYVDLAGNRLFYLNSSADHIREVTLTITKRDESSIDPTFRLYGRFRQCLLMSTPTASSGSFRASGTFQRDGIGGGGAQYSGILWTPDLAKSPVSGTATYKFKVYFDSKDSLCSEGFVQVDMIAPADINSVGNYSDGDHLYFVKKDK